MRYLRHASLALALAVGFSGAAQAQTVGYNIRSGDVWLDSRVGEVNNYGTRYREPFINELNRNYGAPRPFLVELLERRGWSPGDVYYACALARSLNVPCQDIVRDYDRDYRDEGARGWGALAMSRGIKPGSPAFHALKRGTVATYDRWGYPITLTDRSRVDWSKGKSGKSKATNVNLVKGKPVGVDKGPMKVSKAVNGRKDVGHAKGASGKSDKGNGGKDKGNKGNGNGKG